MKSGLIILSLYLFLGCTSDNKENDKKDKELGTFAWKAPVLLTYPVATSIASDSLTLSVIFDNANYRIRKDEYNTTINFTVAIPFSQRNDEYNSIRNDLRYFISKDSLTSVDVFISADDTKYNLDFPKDPANLSLDTIYSFVHELPQNQEQEEVLQYHFTIEVSKPKGSDEVLIQMNTMDIIAEAGSNIVK